jgi:DNA (cytosine-5)-methyltransferase 1
MNVLNLYSGLLGNRRGWGDLNHVTNVELMPDLIEIGERDFPTDGFKEEDAHQYLLRHSDLFDFIWSSPPCQSHTQLMKFTRHKVRKYPDMALYQEILFLQHFFKGKWVVENVVPYYEPLIKPTAKIGRHLFWSNFPISPMMNEPKQPKNFTKLATVEGKKVMMDWLGIHYDQNIYYGGNHCPVQVLRNAVHPLIGKHVFDCAFNQVKEISLFDNKVA